jgi:pseudouridine-5'-monophosphatase
MFALFDCDGLLLDTERVYGEATQQILNRFGKKFEWSMKSQMMGLRGPEAAQLLVDQLKIPMTAQEYLDEREILHVNNYFSTNSEIFLVENVSFVSSFTRS